MLERQDLERFVEEYGDHAYSFAYSLCGNEPDAVELVQESFVKIFDKADRFRVGQPLESWFMSIMKNLFMDGRRRWERKNGVSLDEPVGDDGLTVADAVADAREEALLDRLERQEREEGVRKALESLSPKYRTVLTMVDVNGLGYEETALVMGWPLNTVRSRVNRGRAALRAKLLESEVAA